MLIVIRKPAFILKSLTVVLLLSCMGYGGESQGRPKVQNHRDPVSATARLERLVRQELVMLPYYSVFDNLAFKVEGGQVELLGQVNRPTLITDAERLVRAIEGVEGVKNSIEVLPVSSHDDQIRFAVYRAIYGHTALQRYGIQAVPPIHIIVKKGNVFLEGIVANAFDKNIAGIQANGVSGVFSVTNNLRTEN